MSIEPPPKSSKRYLRLSSSPAKSPLLVHAHRSQKSVRPEMSSIYGLPDTEFPPPRSTNRFSSSTNESSAEDTDGSRKRIVAGRSLRRVAGDLGSHEGRRAERQKSMSPSRKKASYLGTAPEDLHASRCEPSEDDDMTILPAPPMEDTDIPPSSEMDLTDFLKLTPDLQARPNPPPTPVDDGSRETSRNNSDATHGSSLSDAAPARARPMNILSGLGQGRVVYNYSPRGSAVFDERERVFKLNTTNQSKADQIMGVHAITMQALLRDEHGLIATTNRFSGEVNLSPTTGERERMSKHFRPVSTESSKLSRRRSASAPAKKVSLLPPPINTLYPKHHLPDDIIRTPYPFLHHKAFPKRSPLSTMVSPQSPAHDSVLILRIRRNNNSFAPLSRLVIPAISTFSFPSSGAAVASSTRSNEKHHFSTLDFDDERFFCTLRAEYRNLAGFWRMWFSARCLKKIVIVVSGADEEHPAWGPRSPRLLVQKGLSDTFSEEKMMEMFRCPKRGRARYAWVHWGHRVASASASPSTYEPLNTPIDELLTPQTAEQNIEGQIDNASGSSYSATLEFVQGWSIAKIVTAILTVLLLAITIALLWTFLGKGGHAGWHGAADRLVTGFVMGIFVALIGSMVAAGWAWVSWMVA